MEEKKKKTSFFKELFSSIKDFEEYQEFALRPLGKAIGYLFKLMLVFAIIASIGFTYRLCDTYQKGVNYVNGQMPEFSYEEGRLSVQSEEPIVYDNTGELMGLVIVDTNIQEQEVIDEYVKKVNLYQNGMILLKDKVIMKNAVSTSIASQNYTDIFDSKGITKFERQDLVDYFNNLNPAVISITVYLVTAIYIFILYLITSVSDTILMGIMGLFLSRILGVRMKFKSSFAIAVHAITFPILLNAIYIVVNLLTGFEIRYFNIMYNTVSLIYVVTAILIIRSNLIKRHMELKKLEEEQQNIKVEIEKQKEEENKKEEKKENKKEPADKDKKKKKKQDPVGDEVKGEA